VDDDDRARPGVLLLFMEFWAYGVRDARMRPKIAARFAQVRELLTTLIADGVREFDLELDIPAEQLAVAIDALADGSPARSWPTRRPSRMS